MAGILQRRLDKSQQCSDWGERPLKDAQILYAAADAACLLDVYDALVSYSCHLDLPGLESLENSLLHLASKIGTLT